MKITVTAEDIAVGAAGEPCSCPIALAVERALGDRASHIGVWVGTHDVEIFGPHRFLDLPQAAQDFIGRFDTALPVEPFEFDLDAS